MKNILFLVASFTLFNAHADDVTGYCHDTVNTAVKAVYQASYPGSEVRSVDTKAVRYSGFHQKAYMTELQSDAGPIKYETLVFEYETAHTACEIDALVTVK